MAVLRECGARLGGLHLELTGEAVTECVGGPGGVTEDRVPERYTSYCDPRLNFDQGVRLGLEVGALLRASRSRAVDGDVALSDAEGSARSAAER